MPVFSNACQSCVVERFSVFGDQSLLKAVWQRDPARSEISHYSTLCGRDSARSEISHYSAAGGGPPALSGHLWDSDPLPWFYGMPITMATLWGRVGCVSQAHVSIGLTPLFVLLFVSCFSLYSTYCATVSTHTALSPFNCLVFDRSVWRDWKCI